MGVVFINSVLSQLYLAVEKGSHIVSVEILVKRAPDWNLFWTKFPTKSVLIFSVIHAVRECRSWRYIRLCIFCFAFLRVVTPYYALECDVRAIDTTFFSKPPNRTFKILMLFLYKLRQNPTNSNEFGCRNTDFERAWVRSHDVYVCRTVDAI